MEPKTTSRASARLRRKNPSVNGFTLIEIMVGIVIIIIFAGVLLPMVLTARKAARNQRLKADLNTIAVALEAYRMDFQDYPTISPDAGSRDATGSSFGNGYRTGIGGASPNVWGS